MVPFGFLHSPVPEENLCDKWHTFVPAISVSKHGRKLKSASFVLHRTSERRDITAFVPDHRRIVTINLMIEIVYELTLETALACQISPAYLFRSQ